MYFVFEYMLYSNSIAEDIANDRLKVEDICGKYNLTSSLNILYFRFHPTQFH